MLRKSLPLILALALPACHQSRPSPQPIHGGQSGKQIRESWEADRTRESARFTDADLGRMVDRLFVEADPGRANFHGLLYAGSRPVPFLIKALDEPRTWTTVFFRDGFHPDGSSPFERICDLLDETAPPQAAKPVARYLEHPDPRFRQLAAVVLGAIGAADCLEPFKKALGSQDRELRQYAILGLMNGLNRKRRDETFFQAIFPAVVPLLKTGVYDSEGPAGVLMAIDPAKGAPILESPQYFVAGNPQSHQVLRALDRDGVKVRLAILLPLLAQLERLAAKENVRELDYAAALILYARNPDELAENRFHVLINSPSSTIAAAGARGLELLAGIDPHAAVRAAYDEHGFAAMTQPQRYYHAIEDYRDEVDNGGHSQYFYNSSGDVYETAIEGLRSIGATGKAANLSNAAGAFGLLRPAAANEDRRRRTEGFGPLQDGIFKAADASFYESEKRPGERLDVLLALYALQHRSDFAAVPGGPR
ncbi:MAG TPA: DUF4375 domain-containing protein [Bryobacteraceae bacterium]|nr:DUF4375 domain-containing protein [Bryobacteraceae bacterium]